MSVMPAAIASSTNSAGKVFDTATSFTSPRARPARTHARAMRSSTTAMLSRIDTASLDPSIVRRALGTVERGVGEPVGVLVARAQRVADFEFAKTPRDRVAPLLRSPDAGSRDA